MHDEPLWLAPDYYTAFRCKCGDCRSCCCNGWDISVSREEYFRLIGLNCSEDLHHRLECAFRMPEEPSPERFRLISPNWLGECPMRDSDGLCLLQKECGEEMLPEVCRVYPRSLKKEGEALRACCSNGCEAVVEALMAADRLDFHAVRLDARPELCGDADARSLDLNRQCIDILRDRNLPLRDRVAGAAALVLGEDIKILSLPDGLASLQHILRNIHSATLEPFIACISDHFFTPEEFAERGRKSEAVYPHWERWMENLLVNHMAYMGFPRADSRIDAREAVKGLCGVWALLRALCIACAGPDGSDRTFADAAAGLFRMVEHGPFYYNCHVLLDDGRELLSL